MRQAYALSCYRFGLLCGVPLVTGTSCSRHQRASVLHGRNHLGLRGELNFSTRRFSFRAAEASPLDARLLHLGQQIFFPVLNQFLGESH